MKAILHRQININKTYVPTASHQHNKKMLNETTLFEDTLYTHYQCKAITDPVLNFVA